MLPYGIDYAIFEDRHIEHMKQAERRRLTRQTREGRTGRGHLSSALIWLGRRLVVWGQYLEERSVVRPTSQAGSRC